MEHDSSRSGYHEPEPGLAGREDEEDWGDDFPKTFSVNLIWAQACDKEGHDGAIGFEGGMPWHLPEDMRHFTELTVSHPVIMGRKTWESLSPKFRPLPNRDNIVIFEGELASLRRFKDDVKEVASGYECGMQVEKFNDIKVGDVIECFVMEQINQ